MMPQPRWFKIKQFLIDSLQEYFKVSDITDDIISAGGCRFWLADVCVVCCLQTSSFECSCSECAGSMASETLELISLLRYNSLLISWYPAE